MKLPRINQKQLASIILVIAIIVIGYFIYTESVSKKSINDFFVAASNENCQKLQPLTAYSLPNSDVICPRGDVGNFMVVDKVEYKVKNIIGSKFSSTKQVLVSVCIEARGVAAWNQGSYKDCTTDPRIVEFKRSILSWSTDTNQFTNITKMLNETGAEPANYRVTQSKCFETSFMDVDSGGDGLNCNGNVVRFDVEYAIKTHKFAETGKAH